MTTIEHDAAADAPAATSRQRGPIVLLVAVIAVVAGVASWWAWTSYAASTIEVAWDGEPQCAGTSLARDGHAIVTSETMSCDITVTVRNTGPVAVTLDRAVLPYVGPDGGSVVKAVAVDGRSLEGGTFTDVDAFIALDHEIAGGDSWRFRVRIAFRDDGCTDAGRLWFGAWPTITTSYLARDIDVAAAERLEFVSRTRNPGCPR